MKRKRRFVFTNSPQHSGCLRYPLRYSDPEADDNDVLSDTRGYGFTKTDPQGSWTGVPRDQFDEPVQDADDL